MVKINFTEIQIEAIIKLYVEDKLSTQGIGSKFGVSTTPIRCILKNKGLLRKGYSNGVKIELSDHQKDMIKILYLVDNKNCEDIANKLGFTPSFINKYLGTVDYRRDKPEAMRLVKTGVKLSDEVKKNMASAQQKLAKSGNRKQTGGVCKTYMINGLLCQGTYEKFYIDKLIIEDLELPKNGKAIITPFGVYTPDFYFEDRLIEVKSDYTYDVLIGVKVSRFTKKYETKQYEKIKWVNENIKPIDLLIVDKRNNNIIKKEIAWQQAHLV